MSLVLSASLMGCATTGGKLAFTGSAVAAVAAASTVKIELFCGGGSGTLLDTPCPSNTTPMILAGVAAALALTGAVFEITHAVESPERSAPPLAPKVALTPEEVSELRASKMVAQARPSGTTR